MPGPGFRAFCTLSGYFFPTGRKDMTAAHRERVGRDHCKTAVIIRGGDVCSQVAIFEKTENVLKEDRRMSCNWQCVAVVLNSFRKGPDSRYFRLCQARLPRWRSGKESACWCRRRKKGRFSPLGEGMATRSNILAWRIPRREEPGGPQSVGLQS